VPPLNTMGGDKMLLLEHFRDFYTKQMQRKPFALDETAQSAWSSYTFPGNTRELRNIVIRLVTKYAGAKVNPSQLEAEFEQQFAEVNPASGESPNDLRRILQQGGFNLDDMLMGYTQKYIDTAMELAQGNVSEAAKLLGIARTTLYSRMEALQKHRANQ